MSAQLTRGRIAAASVALVSLAAVAVLVIVAARWWDGEGGAYAPRATLAQAEVTPVMLDAVVASDWVPLLKDVDVIVPFQPAPLPRASVIESGIV